MSSIVANAAKEVRMKRVPIRVEPYSTYLERRLEPAGSSLERVVKCNIYCTDASQFAKFNEVYARYFPVESPARIFLCVTPFPGPLDVEIDCVAVI